MIIPIRAYGDPVLRKEGLDIDKNYEDLEALIKNMFETMHSANGVGLAAPQVGKAIRLFLVDSAHFLADSEDIEEEGITQVFINAEILEEKGEYWDYNEGCLSIPGIREDVSRQDTITIKYLDENFEEHTETFTSITARVIQHEYDHIDGILFTDHLKPIKKKLLKKKLNNISKGIVDIDYKMKFPLKKR